MMDEKLYNELINLFDKTVHNCTFYLNRNKPKSFLNEVGTGKGILYTLELMNKLPVGESLNLFMSYIEKSKELLKEERRTMFK